jgi:hypothetical protein
MDDDLRGLLREMYRTLEQHQQTLWKIELLSTSLLGVLRESYPNFETLYAKHFEAAKRSPAAKDNEIVLQLLRRIIQGTGGDLNQS